MAYSKKIKNKATELRQAGLSIGNIAKTLSISKSTASLWVKHVPLPTELRAFLKKNELNGRIKGQQIMKAKRELKKKIIQKEAQQTIKNIPKKNNELYQLYAAIIFWCEGNKKPLNCVNLANSDPKLIETFLLCLRKGFKIDEKKLHALIHLHDYHNEKKQLEFWSKVTKIPKNQFYNSYKKTTNKIRKRKNYPGCLSLRYSNADLARKLTAIYHTFTQNLGL